MTAPNLGNNESSKWVAKLSSGPANATVIVRAQSKSDAKNLIFNQFLGIQPSEISWDSAPTFWVVMHSIHPLDQESHEA